MRLAYFLEIAKIPLSDHQLRLPWNVNEMRKQGFHVYLDGKQPKQLQTFIEIE